jgi:hypothetical protein
VNAKFEDMLLEAIVVCFELHRPIVERLENATKSVAKKLVSGQNFNPEPPEYELEVLPTTETDTHFLCFRDTCHIPCVTAIHVPCVITP